MEISPEELREALVKGGSEFTEYIEDNIKEMIAAQDMAALMEESHKEFNRLRRAMGLPEIRPDEDITDEALTIETAFGKPVKIL